MTIFAPGDRVHLAGIGTGVVREVRSGGRYVIEIKGRAVVAAERHLERASAQRSRAANEATVEFAAPQSCDRPSPSLDLHGKTVVETLELLEVFINDALLAGTHEVRVVHGRSGGRVKAAVHRYLRQLPSIGSARLDPHNPGVTIVTFS